MVETNQPDPPWQGSVFERKRNGTQDSVPAWGQPWPSNESALHKNGGAIRVPSADSAIKVACRESREDAPRLSALVASIQEDERRRIALDLHDGLGQSLSLVKLSIEHSIALLTAGATREASESLQQVIPRVQETLVEVRRVAMELRPLTLDDLGLLPTLSWFFREFEAVARHIVIEKSLDVPEEEVPVRLHITLYRILQEAFHNILKHAAARRVWVSLKQVGESLELAIIDDGRGFDPSSIYYADGDARGLGLLSMRERASYSGGNYHLRSAPGEGTCIRVSWRCSLEDKASARPGHA